MCHHAVVIARARAAVLVWAATAWLTPAVSASTSTPLPDLRAQSTASAAPLSTTADTRLRERASAWWLAREKRDHLAMYDFFEPIYRAKVPVNAFLQESVMRSRGDIAAYRPLKTEPLPDGTVKVTGEIQSTHMKFGGPYPVTVEDLWREVDGEWFKVYEPYRPPFPGSAPASPSAATPPPR